MTQMDFDRNNRLVKDFERVTQLSQLNSLYIAFQVDDTLEHYAVTLRCNSVRMKAGLISDIREHHVSVGLGPDYPVMPPDLFWETPIFHPNINVPGVCLLSKWGSSTTLDDVFIWLWDMARYRIYNLDHGLDNCAAEWAKANLTRLPLDARNLLALPRQQEWTDLELQHLISIRPEEDSTS